MNTKNGTNYGTGKTAARTSAVHLLVAYAILAAATLGSCAMPEIRVTTPVFAGLADGAYKGFYDGGMVKAEVEVTVTGGVMTEIRILKHDCGTGKPAEVIVQDIMAAQSLKVDVISGSTYSSKVILKAVEVALTEAL